jgi:methyl-accepting chemotaxis protein
VVAQEVKNPAGQTAKATDEIRSHIVDMQRATGESVEAIKAIGQTIERISEITTLISSAVEEQGTAYPEHRGRGPGRRRRHPRCC